jgi:UPF0755 protein
MLRRLLLRLLIVALLGTVLAGGWLYWRYQQFLATPLAVGDDGAVVLVANGTGLRRLSDQLAVAGLLEWPEMLVLYGRLNGLDTRIQAGEYRVEPGLTPPGLLVLITSGKVVQHALTLVEGWTFDMALAAVRGDPVLVATLDPQLDADAVMARLGHPGEHPEGRFFPDTYLFPRGTRDVDFLERAYRTMAQQLALAWAARAPDLPYATPYEALILASIVEKETGLPEERQRIAGVFVRRLQRGMRLQADPTVIYGLGAAFDGDLRRDDLRTDTPYNSYTRTGLPPTPIALPGRAALDAALQPEPGNWLYFVARGDGGHVFSETLAEHQAAVRKYQLLRP